MNNIYRTLHNIAYGLDFDILELCEGFSGMGYVELNLQFSTTISNVTELNKQSDEEHHSA
jgi:hypothetical protein